MPRIIPVIDVMDGVVVHGIGGRRETYKPIQSTIVDSTEPLKVAEAMLAKTGSKEIYIADLDAIRGNGVPSKKVLRLIHALDATIWLDHGVRSGLETPCDLQDMENVHLIVGTETCDGPLGLSRIIDQWPRSRIAVSIDLFSGMLTGNLSSWDHKSYPRRLVELIVDFDISNYIIIDVAYVGTKRDTNTLYLCEYVKRLVPDADVMTGGGVRSRQNLKFLLDFCVDAVLCATAIHDGSLP